MMLSVLECVRGIQGEGKGEGAKLLERGKRGNLPLKV